MKPVTSIYFEKEGTNEDALNLLQASSSLPIIAPVVIAVVNNYWMAGFRCTIPVVKHRKMDYEKSSRYFDEKPWIREEKIKFGWIAAKAYKKYPNLVNTMLNRYEVYDATLHYIEKEEQAGNIICSSSRSAASSRSYGKRYAKAAKFI